MDDGFPQDMPRVHRIGPFVEAPEQLSEQLQAPGVGRLGEVVAVRGPLGGARRVEHPAPVVVLVDDVAAELRHVRRRVRAQGALEAVLALRHRSQVPQVHRQDVLRKLRPGLDGEVALLAVEVVVGLSDVLVKSVRRPVAGGAGGAPVRGAVLGDPELLVPASLVQAPDLLVREAVVAPPAVVVDPLVRVSVLRSPVYPGTAPALVDVLVVVPVGMEGRPGVFEERHGYRVGFFRDHKTNKKNLDYVVLYILIGSGSCASNMERAYFREGSNHSRLNGFLGTREYAKACS